MNARLLVCCLSALVMLLAGCKTTRVVDVDEARSAYADAHLNLKSGETTLADVVAKYGPFRDRAVTPSGFACRWQERRTVVRRANRHGDVLSLTAGPAGEYHYTVNYLSTLEAFFTPEGKLIDFRITSDLP